MSLTIVGTVAYDGIETPFGKRERVLGGAAMYAALSASYLTATPGIISVVGDDFLDSDRAVLTDRGIDLEGVETVAGGKCFYWAGYYHANMNKRDTLVTDLNVLADFKPVVPASFQDSDSLLLGNLSPSVQLSVLDQFVTRPKFIALDTMNFWMDIALDELLEVIKRVDLLTINDEEAQQLSGIHNIHAAAKKILTMGPKFLIIKKGEHGAILYSADGPFAIPSYPVDSVCDPTGAGDTFAGGFMGYLDNEGSYDFAALKRSLAYATAMGSFNVEAFGPERLLELSAADISSRVDFLKAYTQF